MRQEGFIMNNTAKQFGSPNIRPVRDLRNNYAEIAKLIEGHEPVFITNNGRGEAVIINIEDYADYEEYLYEKYVAEKLAEAEAAAATSKKYSIDELDAEMRAKLGGV